MTISHQNLGYGVRGGGGGGVLKLKLQIWLHFNWFHLFS